VPAPDGPPVAGPVPTAAEVQPSPNGAVDNH